MTLRPLALSLAASLAAALFAGCGDDSEEGNPGNGTGGSSHTPPVRPPAAYECSAHKWMNVSDSCWSCLCGACQKELDACNTSCTDIFECAHEKGTLVDDLSQINCEIRATLIECIGTPDRQAVAQQLINFDTCLIGKGSSAGTFRICDAECATPYPGDVCERFPE